MGRTPENKSCKPPLFPKNKLTNSHKSWKPLLFCNVPLDPSPGTVLQPGCSSPNVPSQAGDEDWAAAADYSLKCKRRAQPDGQPAAVMQYRTARCARFESCRWTDRAVRIVTDAASAACFLSAPATCRFILIPLHLQSPDIGRLHRTARLPENEPGGPAPVT